MTIANILNYLFDYKIEQAKSYLLLGFPISSYLKVINKLELLRIDYKIKNIDKKYQNNHYKEYLNKGIKEYQYKISIDKIVGYLKNDYSLIEEVLNLCMKN